ncbi:hypothetical protein DNL40_07065 [Xylanimonas oleitrophica]|uniref:Uncharacterized protein n=1 Tax=Xylanimonas oleitrophica TaxID=2607479 RepID=A0A2W5WQP5_9MICO|nr:hypothetical protein [Xylanimonas oleitrophica]PZR53859.1 hypothetical protein DNL40_07065 [Xylanimonas oleitrophica]
MNGRRELSLEEELDRAVLLERLRRVQAARRASTLQPSPRRARATSALAGQPEPREPRAED